MTAPALAPDGVETTAPRRPPRRFRPRRAPAPLAAAALMVAAVCALPLGYLAWHGAGLGGEFVDVLREERVGGPLRRTLALAASVALGATALGTVLAWLVTRTDLPGRRVWRVVVPLPLVIPSFVGAFALVAMFAPGGLVDSVLGVELFERVEGFWAAWTVLVLLTYPYVYLPVAARLESLPRSLEESARALGRRPREVFRTVVLPQCSGAIWAGALLVFLYCLAEFGAVQLLRYDTLTRAIFSAWLFDRDVAVVLGAVLAAAALAVVTIDRARAARRVHTEAVAPTASVVQTRLGAWRAPATVLVAGVAALALLTPVVVLAHWTARGVVGDAPLDAGEVVRPALTTAWLGLVTAVAAVAVMLPLGFATVRYRSRAGEVGNGVVVSAFALPGLVTAIAIVFAVVRSPFADLLYQTWGLLVLAYVVHFGAQSLRAAQVAVAGVPRRIEDAARSLGAGRARRLRTVQLPLMRPGLLAGAGLVLLSTMKELPATLVLAPTGAQTLATEVWSAHQEGFFAQAGAASLVLLALSAALTWVLTIRPARGAR
jgi:iron(III) transport system permease protein